jgi:4-diphosphocytidyl-2-C-methyl-D-erythritol kinase
MKRAPAPAKINLALVVGARQEGAKHEVTTVLQRVDIVDRVSLAAAESLRVDGFRDDTLVRRALTALAAEASAEPRWAVRLEKRIPVGAGLGGGSSDAATALRLANATLERPVPRERLLGIAAGLGADVPFFLVDGPQLGEADGSRLTPLDLPQDFWIVVVLPRAASKASTRVVYEEFDRRGGPRGYGERRARLLDALARVRRPRDLAGLPPNDLASSPLTRELTAAGAFRADVSGAGPAVYGLFHHRRPAEAAQRLLAGTGRSWLTVPAWYG